MTIAPTACSVFHPDIRMGLLSSVSYAGMCSSPDHMNTEPAMATSFVSTVREPASTKEP